MSGVFSFDFAAEGEMLSFESAGRVDVLYSVSEGDCGSEEDFRLIVARYSSGNDEGKTCTKSGPT